MSDEQNSFTPPDTSKQTAPDIPRLGDPLHIRQVIGEDGTAYDAYHPPKLYKNSDGTMSLVGGLPAQNTEQSANPEPAPAYKTIFEGVYNQLRLGASGQTIEEQGQNFVEIFKAKKIDHIDPIESQNIPLQTIYHTIWNNMAQYIMKYSNSSRFEEKKTEVSNTFLKLTGHINNLVQNGQVDELTAKLFARRLKEYKQVGGYHYNAITNQHKDVPVDVLIQNREEYDTTVKELFNQYGTNVQEEGAFFHFNSQNQSAETTSRIYISPDLTQSPSQLLQAWQKALEKTGLQDKLYFKVPIGVLQRQEGIVVYLNNGIDPAEIKKALEEFSKTCPENLLESTPMPSAIPIRRGIAYAPELKNINTFLKHSGSDEIISYNEWVASTTELAFELAYHELTQNGQTNATPKLLKVPAEKYFEKIAKLSGINPETMVPNSLGGQLPSWAKKS